MKLGCWGPVVKCNVPKRGWINGVGGCPNVGGICIGCTMPGFPDKFMPFMDEPPGARCRPRASELYGSAIRSLRRFTQKTVDEEPKWRAPGKQLLDRVQGRVEVATMATRTPSRRTPDGLVEMAWDPITRIVGSLGIYTKIDFGNQRRSPSATAPRRSSAATASS